MREYAQKRPVRKLVLNALVSVTVVNPATEEAIAELLEIGHDEADEAVARARAAFPAWRAVSPTDRARLLRRLATLVE
jgi:acyl-CoA reductase-like NAD-dependent aldehyde dehydrogenase